MKEKAETTTKRAVNDAVVELCNHKTTIGSYPGQQVSFCRLPKGHYWEHEGVVSWAQLPTECEDCD